MYRSSVRHLWTDTNYEYFKLSSMPGVMAAYRQALKKADAISCVSLPLKCKLEQNGLPSARIQVIENAVDTQLFFPRQKKQCREYFRLPQDVKLIGTAGALDPCRGIENLYEAFSLLAESNDRLHLVVAGKGSRAHAVFQHANVHDLGTLRYEQIPLFWGMLDVAVICKMNNAFGRYCFPQKAHEILACGTPMLAADVGVMAVMLKFYPECLFKSDCVVDLMEKIRQQIDVPNYLQIPVNTWSEQAGKLEALMKTVVENFPGGLTNPWAKCHCVTNPVFSRSGGCMMLEAGGFDELLQRVNVTGVNKFL